MTALRLQLRTQAADVVKLKKQLRASAAQSPPSRAALMAVLQDAAAQRGDTSSSEFGRVKVELEHAKQDNASLRNELHALRQSKARLQEQLTAVADHSESLQQQKFRLEQTLALQSKNTTRHSQASAKLSRALTAVLSSKKSKLPDESQLDPSVTAPRRISPLSNKHSTPAAAGTSRGMLSSSVLSPAAASTATDAASLLMSPVAVKGRRRPKDEIETQHSGAKDLISVLQKRNDEYGVQVATLKAAKDSADRKA